MQRTTIWSTHSTSVSPPVPTPRTALASPPRTAFVQDPASPTTTTPAVRTTPADLHNYQLTTIGGLADFHFYPVIIHGNVATIYPHNNVLRYGHEYIVQIDAGVFTLATGDFAGFTTDHAWRFTTKPAPPPADTTRVVVAADGSGDFNTVQGAVDFVPDNPPKRVTIFIRNGAYEEIVFFRNKANLTFRGEDREKVQVGYGNNSAFNPPMPGPNRRCAFSAYDSTGIEFINFTLNNYFFGQAEALLISGSKNIVSHMTIKGSGDALNLRGSVYLTDSTIIGDGDTILGVGPAFFRRCEIQSVGPFHVDSQHRGEPRQCFRRLHLHRHQPPAAVEPALGAGQRSQGARAPAQQSRPQLSLRRGGAHRLPPQRHSAGRLGAHRRRYLAHSLLGVPQHRCRRPPIDVTERHPVSKQLTKPQDSQTIARYSDPTFVLGGWTPVVDQ